VIPDLLSSLADQTLPSEEFEVVVVDDGSKDRTVDVVHAFFQMHPRMTYRVCSQAPSGVNAARNLGVTESQGDVVCFLDDDEVAPPTYLGLILETLEENPEVAGAGGPARDTGTARVRTCQECSLGDAEIHARSGRFAPALLGGNMAIRRSAFDEVGLFDALLSGRGDESEWFHRSQRPFVYDDSLFIWHRRDAFTLQTLARAQFRQGRNLPRAMRGQGREWTPSTKRLLGYTGHAARRRCARGVLLAAREVGATVEYSRDVLRRRFGDVRRQAT
jgi:glycosyltransferase involved in cell wall biosynthesis